MLTSVFSFAMSFGGLTPLLALTLDQRSVDSTTIGLVVAAQPLGTILAAPFVPRLLRRFGAVDAILLCGTVSVLSIALLPAMISVPAWIALRFVAGVAGAGPWIIMETWFNQTASDRTRARMIATYASVLAAGFASGPLVLSALGSQGNAPFAALVILHGAALAPIACLRGRIPKLSVAASTRLMSVVAMAPVLFAAAIVAGLVDIAFFSFLPIWGLRNGLEEAFAVTLLSVFVAGNIVLQYPLGWLADAIGYRRVMLMCGLVCIIGPVLATKCLSLPVLLHLTLFAWGGCAWALYTIALAELGNRLRHGNLAAANAAFVIAYEVANVFGPPAAGAASDFWPEHGLMVMMGLVGLGFVLAVWFGPIGRFPNR